MHHLNRVSALPHKLRLLDLSHCADKLLIVHPFRTSSMSCPVPQKTSSLFMTNSTLHSRLILLMGWCRIVNHPLHLWRGMRQQKVWDKMCANVHASHPPKTCGHIMKSNCLSVGRHQKFCAQIYCIFTQHILRSLKWDVHKSLEWF